MLEIRPSQNLIVATGDLKPGDLFHCIVKGKPCLALKLAGPCWMSLSGAAPFAVRQDVELDRPLMVRVGDDPPAFRVDHFSLSQRLAGDPPGMIVVGNDGIFGVSTENPGDAVSLRDFCVQKAEPLYVFSRWTVSGRDGPGQWVDVFRSPSLVGSTDS